MYRPFLRSSGKYTRESALCKAESRQERNSAASYPIGRTGSPDRAGRAGGRTAVFLVPEKSCPHRRRPGSFQLRRGSGAVLARRDHDHQQSQRHRRNLLADVPRGGTRRARGKPLHGTVHPHGADGAASENGGEIRSAAGSGRQRELLSAESRKKPQKKRSESCYFSSSRYNIIRWNGGSPLKG